MSHLGQGIRMIAVVFLQGGREREGERERGRERGREGEREKHAMTQMNNTDKE